jgi:phage-related holin
MLDLKRNLLKGDYKIPKNIKVTPDCLNFLEKCLKADQMKRLNFKELLVGIKK